MRPMIGLTLLLGLLAPRQAVACPFCSASQPTVTERLAGVDVVVIATRAERAAAQSSSPLAEEKVTFLFQTRLKGGDLIKNRKSVSMFYFSRTPPDARFLLTGTSTSEGIRWSKPQALNAISLAYILEIRDLPPSGHDRMAYFLRNLESKEEMLAKDAYEEFARADYETVQSLKPLMNRKQLLEWIQTPDIVAARRRLYLTLLGVCGQPDDIPALERIVTSDDAKVRLLLDAAVGCYLTLMGDKGLGVIEEHLLKNPKSDYGQIYSVVLALRFHLQASDVISKEKLVRSLKLVLKRKKFAHLVIPDLARAQDWSVIDELAELFRDPGKNTWIRVPIVQYLLACPKPEAKTLLASLGKIDPQAIRHAKLIPAGAAGASVNSP